ncbi:MAG TPA: nicotinate phosphoribosyltransferase [Chloroflexota bacterium]|nr:nicotinate phosphoribosyltransferase [Chloroflexota bacterium]
MNGENAWPGGARAAGPKRAPLSPDEWVPPLAPEEASLNRSYVAYHPGLMTDLYHPDAAYVAWRHGKLQETTFDLYTRRAPFGSAYLLVAGLEQALEFLQAFHYSDEDLAFLQQVRDYDRGFLSFLRGLRFTGEVLAMAEGTVAFAEEPLLRVTGPFCEALLLESGLLQAVNLSTLIATKAARVVWASQGRRVAEFGARRAQEPFTVARASYIGGCTSTSFLAAAFRFRLPATGSIPHALVQCFPSEEDAFEAVAETFNRYTLLLDTYDVRRAIHTAVRVARRVRDRLGHRLAAVRLDSGDLVADAKYVRAVLDEAGLQDVRILGSGDLDEWRIADLLAAGAPFDAFGVGTALAVGAGGVEQGVEGGALGGVYKEVAYRQPDGTMAYPVKVAGPKTTWPGRKEVYRVGSFAYDLVCLADEVAPPGAERLLRPVVLNGRIVPGSLPPISEVWEHAREQLGALPERYKALNDAPAYPVRFSDSLQALRNEATTAAADEDRRVVLAEPAAPAAAGAPADHG